MTGEANLSVELDTRPARPNLDAGVMATLALSGLAAAGALWGVLQPGVRPDELPFDPAQVWAWWPGPPGETLVLFVTAQLAIGLAAFARRPRSGVGQALLAGSASNAASIVLWTSIHADELNTQSPSWLSFLLAGVLSLVLWSSLIHLVLVFPTRGAWVARRPWLVPLVYLAPQLTLLVGASAIGGLPPASLVWLDMWGSLHASIVSVMLVGGIAGIALRYRSVSRPRRRQVRGIALAVSATAVASLLLVDLPIALTGAPILGRDIVIATALPIPLLLGIALWRDRNFRFNRLRRSQMALLHAREEERRRLRRDLHDGLGPTLAAIGLKIDAAASWVVTDPPEAERLLAEIRNDLSATVAETRRLVRGLRPPALDELGLVGAVRRLAEGFSSGVDTVPAITVVATDPPSLPAAVEVAAYRIIQESLTNTVRHARAEHCEVRLAVDDSGSLVIVVSDDGVGFDASQRHGVGTEAMTERAEELGGTLSIESTPDRGTVVRATLPLSAG